MQPLLHRGVGKCGTDNAVELHDDVVRGFLGRGALVLDQLADAIGVVGLIRQHDGSRDEMVEQRVGDLPVMRLPCRQAEPDREPLRVDDDVDLGREPAPGATETVICAPLFAVAAC